MTEEQIMRALENIRRQASTGLVAAPDEGHAFALITVERMAEAFMEILHASSTDDGFLSRSIRAEIQRFLTQRGWAV